MQSWCCTLYVDSATEPIRRNLDWMIEYMMKCKETYSRLEEIGEAYTAE